MRVVFSKTANPFSGQSIPLVTTVRRSSRGLTVVLGLSRICENVQCSYLGSTRVTGSDEGSQILEHHMDGCLPWNPDSDLTEDVCLERWSQKIKATSSRSVRKGNSPSTMSRNEVSVARDHFHRRVHDGWMLFDCSDRKRCDQASRVRTYNTQAIRPATETPYRANSRQQAGKI